MLSFLDKIENITPIIIDHNSTYPPLLEWLSKCPYKVIRSKNIGAFGSLWKLQNENHPEEYFAFTDPDLDLSKCPLDLFDVLRSGLRKYPEITKVGLSLEINDIPYSVVHRESVLRQETRFWENKIDHQFYSADIATTLAVYRSGDGKPPCSIGPALRSDRPYTAKHIDWYTNDTSAEKSYYLNSIKHNTQWSKSNKRRKALREVPFL
jgi:hypothetical protein